MIVGCAAASAIAASASAGVFDFDPPNETGSLGSDLGSDDRSVQVLMLSTFTISSAKIKVDPRLGQSFELILLDLLMPLKNGFDVLLGGRIFQLVEEYRIVELE